MNSIKVLLNSIDNFRPHLGSDSPLEDDHEGFMNGHNETNDVNNDMMNDDTNNKPNAHSPSTATTTNDDDDRNEDVGHSRTNSKSDYEEDYYANELSGINELDEICDDDFTKFDSEKESLLNDSNKESSDDFINPHYSISLFIKLLIQLPNLIIVKPLVWFWNLLLLPFSFLFKFVDFNYSYQLDFTEKTELLKHENLMSNNIKSPTSSSKYIIPPPQRLFPLIRNPHKFKKRKTLILDLDETLIHSLSKGSPRSLNNNNNSNIIEIKLNDIATLYHVHKRPYCDLFLQEVSNWYDLYVFTASVKEYADPIIDWLESEIVSDVKIFKQRFYRNDCTYRNGVGYIKDLSKVFPLEDLKNVIILDNSPISYALHEDNAIMIEGWINDQNDKDLLNLLPMLHSLALCIDVRFILGLRQGEKIFES